MTHSGSHNNWDPKTCCTTYLLATAELEGYTEDVGVLSIDKMTDRSFVGHIYIKEEYWGDGTSIEAANAWKSWLLKNTEYKNIITYSPTACAHVHNFLHRMGFKAVGKLENMIEYYGETSDMLMFQLDLTNKE